MSASTTAAGIIELPIWLYWSTPARTWDLADPQQLRRVYEIVLREGSSVDVGRYIDIEVLLEIWDELTLPPNVRQAWADWALKYRGLRLWRMPYPRRSGLA